MNDFRKLQERYCIDPVFHKVVRAMMNMLEMNSLTPFELREAATFASTMFHMEHGPISMFQEPMQERKDET